MGTISAAPSRVLPPASTRRYLRERSGSASAWSFSTFAAVVITPITEIVYNKNSVNYTLSCTDKPCPISMGTKPAVASRAAPATPATPVAEEERTRQL